MCKQAEPRPGLTTVTLERGELSLVLKNVPALVCPECGEAYADEATAARLLETALEMEYNGLLMDVRQFA
ncbi:MAG: type II toxin-antitoxin system MqsA family antitoxin [Chloroflexi bacterium]|nr:type II toxin-antitoxin system MqsA family antitoxin [Chloroflexota bacterium]